MRALLMCALAVVGAVACSQKKQPPVAAHSPLADSADQVMYGMRFVLTDKGLNRALLESDTAYFFDENTRIELEKVHTTFLRATMLFVRLLNLPRSEVRTAFFAPVAVKKVV